MIMNIIKKQKSFHVFQLAILCCIGIGLRAYHLDNYSLWCDEMFQAIAASEAWTDFFPAVKRHSSPFLDYFFMKLSVSLFGNTEWAVRLHAFIFGTAAIPLFYYFSRLLVGFKTALIAVTLLVFSPMAISFSQEGRMYSLFLFLSLTSYLLTLIFINKNSVRSGISWGIINGLLLLTHYFGVFVILSETIIVLLFYWSSPDKSKRIKRTIGGIIVSFLIFLPWIPVFLFQFKHNSNLGYALKANIDFFKLILFEFTSDTGQPDLWVYSFALVFVFSSILAWYKNEKKIILIVLNIAATLLFLFILSIVKPLVLPRSIIFLLPLFYLVCAYGLSFCFEYFKIKSNAALLITVFLVFWPAVNYHFLPRKALHANWKGAADYIEQHMSAEEKIFTTDFLARSFLSYYMFPDAEYGLSRKFWISKIKKPEWEIKLVDDVLKKDLVRKNFTGWVVLPPRILSKKVNPELRNELANILGQPDKQFPTRGAPLEIYYIEPGSN